VKTLILLCALSVPAGWHYVILTSHYPHLYPQTGPVTWSSTVGMSVEGPTMIYAEEHTHPMGHSWVMDMTLAGECGEQPAPNRIFEDGFETGNIRAWD